MSFLRGLTALLERDWAEHLSYKASVLVDAGVALAHVVTYFFISRLLPAGASPYLARYGGSYFPFALIGIAFAQYHRAALSGLSSALAREQDGGTLELIWLSPAGLPGVLAAGWLWEFFWVTARVALYLAAGAILFGVDFSRASFTSAAATLFLTMSSLAGLGLMSAGFLLVYKRGDPVSYLLDGATRLLSGVYFPVALLPAWLAVASKALPFTFALEALRRAILEGAGLRGLGLELGVLAGWTVVALPLGLWLFGKAVERARRDGSLALR